VKKKPKKSKAKSVKDLAVKSRKGSSVKGGVTIKKVTDASSPNFFRN
jgi:hypothetical protein